MTRSFKPELHLEASAQELLESLNGLILREAHQFAARRRSDTGRNEEGQVSFSDILEILEKRRERGRRRERGIFAAQVTLAAIVISSTVISLAIAILAIGSRDTYSGDSSSSLFVTVLLIMILIVASTVLLTFFREPRESGSRDGERRKSRRSRREDEIALLKEWLGFEELMKRELYKDSSEAPVHNLSDSIVDFSRLYDLDPEEIRSILRVRNAVVHEPRLITSIEIRKSLIKLRLLLEKLSPVRESG